MGVAKHRAVARARLDVEVDIPRLAAAMRKYAMAASVSRATFIFHPRGQSYFPLHSFLGVRC